MPRNLMSFVLFGVWVSMKVSTLGAVDEGCEIGWELVIVAVEGVRKCS